LSGERVGTELWVDWPEGADDEEYARFPHLDFARGVDAVLVAPATANVLAKAAAGLADDLLSTTLLAVDPRRTPVLFVPSMNATMYAHPAVVANRALLRERGSWLVTPDEGPLACGEFGVGRWPGNAPILAALDRLLNGNGTLAGRRVVVTAGRTEAEIDPARTLTNRSTGRMGFAVARAAWRHGADVTLIHGPGGLEAPPYVATVQVRTAEEMADAVLEALPGAAQLWMTAAVNDWRPVQASLSKIKKSEWDGILELEPTVDILARAVVEREPGTVVVGFAVETDDPERRAEEKRVAKGCDYIVVNNPLEEGAGFAHETNAVTLLGPNGLRMRFDRMSKEALADRLLREVVDRSGAASPVR
jgi:phosphopantothenoylcysteine decarboxylase/phosphopantothenate--cysteine ligase